MVGRFEQLLLFILAILPLLVFLPATVQVELMLTCLFLFNVVRGISTGAWLPWLTALVPANARSSFSPFRPTSHAMWWNARYRHFDTRSLVWRSTLAICSALCHQRIGRNVEPSFRPQDSGYRDRRTSRSSGQPVPWLEILKYPPFTKLLIFNVVYNWVVGGSAAFVIAFLEGRAGYTAGQVLAVSLAAAVGAFASVPFFGLVLERTGSKPLLRLAMSLYLVGILFWVARHQRDRSRALSFRRIQLSYPRRRRRAVFDREHPNRDGYDAGDGAKSLLFAFHRFRLSESRTGAHFLGCLSRYAWQERVFDRIFPGQSI